MRDEKRMIVVEEDRKSGDGIAGVFGVLIFIIMLLGLIDHSFTVAWTTLTAWFN